eukprot:5239900-Prymnesium_polylepis.1
MNPLQATDSRAHRAQYPARPIALANSTRARASKTGALPPCALAGARARRRAPSQTIAHAARRTRQVGNA